MTSKVKLVADSTADLDPAWCQTHDVTVVSLRVIIGDQEFRDGIDIDPPALYRRMRAGDVARTSQPTPADFEAAFRKVADNGTPVLCTTISSDMSGTYNSAQQAKAALAEMDIQLFDTRCAAMAHHALVKEAVAVRDAGGDAAAVLAHLKKIQEQQRLVFTVADLEYLKRGGRIGGASAFLGSVLDIKPIIELRDGKVEPKARVRTFAKAISALVDEVAQAVQSWGGKAKIQVAHADRREDAEKLVAQLSPYAQGEIEIMEVGPVIGCHGGPGAMGIAFYPAALSQV